MFYMILTFVLFILVLGMSSSGNPMSWIMSIGLVTRANYLQWWEKVNMGLALFEIDKAITDKCPKVRSHREKENAKLMECYQIEKIN
jgi:hypothetical protein